MSRNDRLYQGVRGRKMLDNLNIHIVTKLRHPTAQDYEEMFGQNHPLASSENILCHESASKEPDALVPSSCVEFPNIASRTPSPSIIESFGMASCTEPSNVVTSPIPSSLTDKETRPYSSNDTLLPNNYPLSLKSKSLSLSDLTNDSVSPYTCLKKYLSLPLLNDNYTLACSENFSSSVMLAFHSNLQNHNLNLSSDTETDFESDHDENELQNIMNEGRKRRHLVQPDEWKRNKAKLRRMQGEKYLGFSNPKNRKFQQDTLRSARNLGPRCTSDFCLKSKLRGCDKLSEECRKRIHYFFWKHMNWDQRKIYINSLVKRSKTAQKTTSDQSRRLETAAYFLPVNSDGSEKVQVCKNMFLNTLSIGSFTVYSWTKHSEYGMSPNQAVRNLSRRSPVRPEIRRKLLTLNSFLDNLPKLPSHYSRKETTKLFLEPIYHSIADLFKIYKKYCTDTEELSVSRFTFEKKFHAKNLSLYTLKKDMCDVCASYKAGNLCEADYQIHLIKKNRARQEKDDDKKKAADGEFILLSMDLEAVKVCPYLTASALYFKTKLTAHNFTVFNLITKQCTCYWFDETAADLTSSTFVSFLVDYIERHCVSRQLPIVIYSDGCTYQNRNVAMANALLNLSKKYNIEITQKFLEPGHTQMECDSVHAAIERKLKNREIHLPSEYGTLTKEVRRSDPYEAIQIDHQFVKNYTSPECYFYKSIRPGRKVGDPQVVDIRAIKYNTMTIETKLNFDEEFTALPQRPKMLGTEIEYQQLHPNRIPIKALKYNHLQQLKAVLPTDCHAFYDALPFE